ncbi:MAG: serine/threonine protein kinase, partial [Deltaproteobacteria bacterium]|nr:serine/threonine protein kinase [Deltaproteobacteria bacterium]
MTGNDKIENSGVAIKLSGYRATRKIHENKNSCVYRGIQYPDNEPVVIKLLNRMRPSTEELSRFKREYEIAAGLAGEDVIKTFSLKTHEDSLAIVMEDFGGDSLKTVFIDHTPDLKETVSLAVKITKGLALIHQQNVIHKDINPANIVWNRKENQVKIIDFSIATQLSREITSVKNPNALEGTLEYISPEQTGRMNRSLDYRTDFYSLGVTFYELFTGTRPFESDDA